MRGVVMMMWMTTVTIFSKLEMALQKTAPGWGAGLMEGMEKWEHLAVKAMGLIQQI